MCKSKAEGGHRCASHSPASRRNGRAATRIFGSNDAKSRQALERLDSKFVHGNIKQRAIEAKYAMDPAIIALAARDPKKAVRDAVDENEHEESKKAALRSDQWDTENLADTLIETELRGIKGQEEWQKREDQEEQYDAERNAEKFDARTEMYDKIEAGVPSTTAALEEAERMSDWADAYDTKHEEAKATTEDSDQKTPQNDKEKTDV